MKHLKTFEGFTYSKGKVIYKKTKKTKSKEEKEKLEKDEEEAKEK